MKMKDKKKKTGQEIQDEIFRKMSADRKVRLGSKLWQLAKKLVGDKINYASSRSERAFS